MALTLRWHSWDGLASSRQEEGPQSGGEAAGPTLHPGLSCPASFWSRPPSCSEVTLLPPAGVRRLPRNGLAHLPALVSWQLQVITGRLRALEDQGATWRHRETLFFTMLVSVCVANLWLWLRQ